jgi:Protein of unknown function (DUF1566)
MSKNVCSTIVAIAVLVASASAVSAQSQSWSQVIAGAKRFILLAQFNGEAVFDKETGLVWQQAPTETFSMLPIASRYCADVSIGNRRGWRLPTLQELKSLTDPSESSPTLTAGHPFANIDLTKHYWSSTVTLDSPNFVWTMGFNVGEVARTATCAAGSCAGAPIVELAAWCVRGGSGADAQ